MGVILRQSIRGSLWSYIGIAVAFITITLCYPKFLDTSTVGLFGLLVSYSAVFSQFALLGIPGMTSRLFSHFRDERTVHHGFSFLLIMCMMVSTLLFALFFSFYHSHLNEGKSELFSENSFLLLPITIFSIMFSLFDNYNKMLYNVVLGVFLQETLQRILILVLILMYGTGLIDLGTTIILYAVALCVKGVVIFVYLLLKGKISFSFNSNILSTSLIRSMTSTALFSVVGGMGISVATNIDKIIMNNLMELSNIGVYTVAFYLGALVVVPSRIIIKIAGTVIAEAWKVKDVELIKKVYYQSSINQFIIGMFIFAGIYANIDNIIGILGNDYATSRWVIFFIGIGYVLEMISGVSSSVVFTSKHYKVEAIVILIRVISLIICLYVCIPLWGITGAAIAVMLSLFFSNLFRHLFLHKKYGMQPVNSYHLVVFLFFASMVFGLGFIPQQALIIDILIRSILLSIFSVIFIYYSAATADVKQIIKSRLEEMINRLRKYPNR